MIHASTILSLIEENPSDKAKLGEIDARVWCLFQGYLFETIGLVSPDVGFPVVYYLIPDSAQTFGQWHSMRRVPKVTRSLDAQATIMPKRDVSISWLLADGTYQCQCRSDDIETPILSTEVLARLDFIIRDFILSWKAKATMTSEMRVALENVVASIKKERRDTR